MAGLGLEVDRVRSHRAGQARRALGRAASVVVERLEERQLLSMTPAEAQQFSYQWNHMGPYARQDLAVAEYENPDFAAKLDADVTALGLTPIAPQAPADPAGPADSKSRHRHPHRHPTRTPKPVKHHAIRHGSAGAKDPPPYAGPTITGLSYSNSTLPQQVTVSFSEDLSNLSSTDWTFATSLLDLNTASTIPISGITYNSTSQARYSLFGTVWQPEHRDVRTDNYRPHRRRFNSQKLHVLLRAIPIHRVPRGGVRVGLRPWSCNRPKPLRKRAHDDLGG